MAHEDFGLAVGRDIEHARRGRHERRLVLMEDDSGAILVDEATGRRNMVEVAGSERKIPAELVLIAAGFLGTEDYIAKAFGVELNQRTNVATEEGHYATNIKNVFTAGDMHRGQSLVVWAIREGREVAREVDESLMGYSYLSIQ